MAVRQDRNSPARLPMAPNTVFIRGSLLDDCAEPAVDPAASSRRVWIRRRTIMAAPLDETPLCGESRLRGPLDARCPSLEGSIEPPESRHSELMHRANLAANGRRAKVLLNARKEDKASDDHRRHDEGD